MIRSLSEADGKDLGPVKPDGAAHWFIAEYSVRYFCCSFSLSLVLAVGTSLGQFRDSRNWPSVVPTVVPYCSCRCFHAPAV